MVSKGPDAFRTISEVAKDLDLPQHVLRFWETRFTQIKPLKRGGGRRYYRPDDIDLLRGIRQLLYGEGYTIKGVQRLLKEQGARFVIGAGSGEIVGDVSAPRRTARDATGQGGNENPLDAEIQVGDDDPDEKPTAPRAGLLKRAIAAPRRKKSASGRRGAGGAADLSGDEVELLQAAHNELVECKRLLDQASGS
jgi:DNA-binding transcriptional MerR regulator